MKDGLGMRKDGVGMRKDGVGMLIGYGYYISHITSCLLLYYIYSDSDIPHFKMTYYYSDLFNVLKWIILFKSKTWCSE